MFDVLLILLNIFVAVVPQSMFLIVAELDISVVSELLVILTFRSVVVQQIIIGLNKMATACQKDSLPGTAV